MKIQRGSPVTDEIKHRQSKTVSLTGRICLARQSENCPLIINNDSAYTVLVASPYTINLLLISFWGKNRHSFLNVYIEKGILSYKYPLKFSI